MITIQKDEDITDQIVVAFAKWKRSRNKILGALFMAELKQNLKETWIKASLFIYNYQWLSISIYNILTFY